MILFTLLALILATYCFFISTELGLSLYTWVLRLFNPPLAERLTVGGPRSTEFLHLLPLFYAIGMGILFTQAPTIYGLPLLIPLVLGIFLLGIRTVVTLWITRTASTNPFLYWLLGLNTIGNLFLLSTLFSFSLYNTATLSGSTINFSIGNILLNSVHWYTFAFVLLNSLLFAALYLAYYREEMAIKHIFSRTAGIFSLVAIIFILIASHFLAEKEFMYQLLNTPLVVPILYGLYAITALLAFGRLFVSFRILHWLLFLVLFSSYYFAQLPYIVRPLLQIGDRTGGLSNMYYILLIAVGILIFLPCLWLLSRWMHTYRGVREESGKGTASLI